MANRGRIAEAEDLTDYKLVAELEYRDYNFAENASDEELLEECRCRSLSMYPDLNLDIYSSSVFEDVVRVFEAQDMLKIKIIEQILKI